MNIFKNFQNENFKVINLHRKQYKIFLTVHMILCGGIWTGGQL